MGPARADVHATNANPRIYTLNSFRVSYDLYSLQHKVNRALKRFRCSSSGYNFLTGSPFDCYPIKNNTQHTTTTKQDMNTFTMGSQIHQVPLLVLIKSGTPDARPRAGKPRKVIAYSFPRARTPRVTHVSYLSKRHDGPYPHGVCSPHNASLIPTSNNKRQIVHVPFGGPPADGALGCVRA